MKQNKIIPLLIFLVVLGGLVYGIKYYYDDSQLWRIKITYEDGINIRSDHYSHVSHFNKAYAGEKYIVHDVWNEDPKFVWYQVELTKTKLVWIASAREEPWVEEINNPKAKKLNTNYIDYDKPEVNFTTTPYETNTLNTITYDHVEIFDRSKYEVSHQVYLEGRTENNPEEQYWLEITVEDIFGNVTNKTQKVVFTTNPNPNDIKDFSVLEAKRQQ